MIRLAFPYTDNQELKLVYDVLSSGNLVEGRMVRAFERETCDWIGVDHGVACTSATIGLELVLRAMGIGKGDQVIIPGFTHPATAMCVMAVGATPATVDVDPETYNVNARIIRKAITKNTKAIMPVSLFGRPLDIEPIIDLGIPVVEDAACSLGSEKEGKRVGSQCTAVFSFHPRKVFATGDGGLIVTNDGRLADKIRKIKHFGAFQEWGTNYRMSDILGAVALAQVRRIDHMVTMRQSKAAIYDALLGQDTHGGNYQSYVVKVKARDRTIKIMKEKGIETQVGTYALHTLPVFKGFTKWSVSQELHERLLTLPLHYRLTDIEQQYIIETLTKIQSNERSNLS